MCALERDRTSSRTAVHVAIVGAGPAGIYSADALLRSGREVSIDILDRLPVPFGLVRHGVAPDHPRTKSVVRQFSKVFADPRVRFLGDVAIGELITVDELRSRYDLVVVATGAVSPRQLDIDGADHPGVVPAVDVVSWYSGHPDASLPEGLGRLVGTSPRVVIIGAGNVALDLARLLLTPPDRLLTTDMPTQVVDVLGALAPADVTVVARRGPEQARFTLPMLMEIGGMDWIDHRIHPAVAGSTAGWHCEGPLTTTSQLLEFVGRQVDTPAPVRSRLSWAFSATPIEILNQGSTLRGVRIDHADRIRTIPADLIISATGSVAHPPPGLPVIPGSGAVHHHQGRVAPGLYVAGWLKRGAGGVIGTNRLDARETVASALDDLDNGVLPQIDAQQTSLDQLLNERGHRPVFWDGWRLIDEGERALGRNRNTDRVTIAGREELLAIARRTG